MAKGTKKIGAKRIGAKKIGTKRIGAKRIGKTQKRIGKTQKRIGAKRIGAKKVGGKWSMKYKKSINCNRPKGFSQKQHCKYGRKMRGGQVHNPWESKLKRDEREKREEQEKQVKQEKKVKQEKMTDNNKVGNNKVFADELRVGNYYKIVLDPKINSQSEIDDMHKNEGIKHRPDEYFEYYSAVYLRLENKTKSEGQYSLQFSYKTGVETDNELTHHIYVEVRPTFVLEEKKKEEEEEEEEKKKRRNYEEEEN